MGQRWWVVSRLATLWLPNKIKIAENQMINSYLGCPEQDSNLHASQHAHLKRARLPFRHLGNNHYFIEHAPCAFFVRAENEARTRDPNLGKVVLYQLSYFRICITKNKVVFAFAVAKVDIFHKPANNYRTFLILQAKSLL